MEDKTMHPQKLQTAADYEAAFAECLSQMQQMRERIDRDQAEIDRLKAETRAVLAQLRAM